MQAAAWSQLPRATAHLQEGLCRPRPPTCTGRTQEKGAPANDAYITSPPLERKKCQIYALAQNGHQDASNSVTSTCFDSLRTRCRNMFLTPKTLIKSAHFFKNCFHPKINCAWPKNIYIEIPWSCSSKGNATLQINWSDQLRKTRYLLKNFLLTFPSPLYSLVTG